MNTAIARRADTQRAEDLHRLADQGERKGIRILVDHRTGQHVATSASDPSRCYQVDAERGCTCKGYGAWGRCQHFALLLSELGRLPEVEPDVVLDEQPAPIVTAIVIQPAPCRSCHGAGYVKASTGGHLGDWVAAPCTSCTGHRDGAHAA